MTQYVRRSLTIRLNAHKMHDLISIIIPIHNGSEWMDSCFRSIINQNRIKEYKLEICICNDASTDNTSMILTKWMDIFQNASISMKIYENKSGKTGGVGYSKNRAIAMSSGAFLCFQDIDDVMLPNRIYRQYQKASELPNDTIIGSKFKREPENSTLRYTKWANNLTPNQLEKQIFTSNGPTIIMPTWFCHRSVYQRVGKFSEMGRGTPEDLIFFYRHLDLGGKICRIDEPLLIYTYHMNAATFSINQIAIWNLRIKRLEEKILKYWNNFTIWNAGKQGRKLYRSLSIENRGKVQAFCDVDKKKIGRKYIFFDEKHRKNGPAIEIIHYKKAEPPFVICIKLDLTDGAFENNLNGLRLEENKDYILFS